MEGEAEKRRRIRSSSVGQKSTVDDPPSTTRMNSSAPTSSETSPVFPSHLRHKHEHHRKSNEHSHHRKSHGERPKTTYEWTIVERPSEVLDPVYEKPRVKIKKKKGHSEEAINEQAKAPGASLSATDLETTSEGALVHARSQSFDKIDHSDQTEESKGREDPTVQAKLYSKKESISHPTDFRHIEIKSYLSTSHVIPHRFKGYSFTSLKSPKCAFCGSGFKGIRHKAYKCSECQYLCHPSCLPNVPPDCGLRPDLVNSRRTSTSVQSKGAFSSSSSSNANARVFGVELARQLELEGGSVPKIIELCIAAVEKRGLELQGLYRISGANSQILKLREAFVSGSVHLEDPEWSDITVVTSVLKQYLRELPCSLLIPEIYGRLMDLIKIEDEAIRIAGIKKALEELPQVNKATLAQVVKHLAMVDKSSAVNKMTSYNLSLLFGPTLMKGPNPVQDLEDMQEQARVIEHLIVHHDQIF